MWILYRASGQTEFFTLNKDYTVGSPAGGFVTDRALAFGFARERDATEFKNRFLSGTIRSMEIPDA